MVVTRVWQSRFKELSSDAAQVVAVVVVEGFGSCRSRWSELQALVEFFFFCLSFRAAVLGLECCRERLKLHLDVFVVNSRRKVTKEFWM